MKNQLILRHNVLAIMSLLILSTYSNLAMAVDFTPFASAKPVVYQGSTLLTHVGPVQTDTSMTWAIKNGTTTVGSFVIINPAVSKYTISFKPISGNSYSFGIIMTGQSLRYLAPGTPPANTTSIRYPYDWDINWDKNTLKSRLAPVELIMPGVLLDGQVITHNSYSLYEIKVAQIANERWSATFFKQREFNDGRDRVSRVISIGANQTSSFGLNIHDSVKKAQRAKVQTISRAVVGQMTQIPFQGWGGSQESSYLTDAEFNNFARKYAASGMKHVILRLNEPKPHIAQIFRNHGLIPHYYIFLGVSRSRIAPSGDRCYSLMNLGLLDCVEDLLGVISSQNTLRYSIDKEINSGRFHTPLNPSWAFLNLRQQSNRNILVQQARTAILNGFQGVFFDGPQIWVANDGYVGGEDRGTNISWYNARAQLLQEVKKETESLYAQKLTPGGLPAYIGLVGNQYTDYQAMADYMVKEIANWVPWVDADGKELTYHPDPTQREVNISENYVHGLKLDYTYYVPTFYLAAKGGKCGQVRQMHVWAAEQKTGGQPYIEFGDFKQEYFNDYANIIANVSANINTCVLP